MHDRKETQSMKASMPVHVTADGMLLCLLLQVAKAQGGNYEQNMNKEI